MIFETECMDNCHEAVKNVMNILLTPKGSVPSKRDFGLDMSFTDRNPQAARVLLVAAVKTAVEKYEPRIEVTGIEFSADEAGRTKANVKIRRSGR